MIINNANHNKKERNLNFMVNKAQNIALYKEKIKNSDKVKIQLKNNAACGIKRKNQQLAAQTAIRCESSSIYTNAITLNPFKLNRSPLKYCRHKFPYNFMSTISEM